MKHDGQTPLKVMSRQLSENKIIAIALLVGAVVFTSDASGSGEEVRLDVRVFLKKVPYGKYLVHLKLTNCKKLTASIVDIQLPWLATNEFMILPEGNRLDATHSKIRRGGPFADCNGTEYRIEPGESIEGDIVLEGLFPTIVEVIRRYGVRIRWACNSKTLHLTCEQGKGGSFIIPKGGLS